MKIANKNISDLKPYENNPRINDHAVEQVANSINEFGFKVPLVVDKKNVIVAGHTRLKAAIQLGIKQVPCVVADDLTPEQIKGFRLADNKVAESALWDEEMLAIELDDLSVDFDMSDFGFELPDFDFVSEDDPDDPPAEDQGYYGDERERTAEIYKLWEYDELRAAGKYQLPTLSKTDHVPDRTAVLSKGKDFDAAGFAAAVKKAKWPAHYNYEDGADWWLRKNAKKYDYTYSKRATSGYLR